MSKCNKRDTDNLFIIGPGRPRIVKSPDHLWDLFCQYIEERTSQPVYSYKEKITEGVGETKTIEKEKKRLWVSLEDFQNWLGVGPSYLRDISEEFSSVTARIREEMKQAQLRGVMSGDYKENIVARLLGISDKSEIDVKQRVIPAGMNKEQAKEFLANMNK